MISHPEVLDLAPQKVAKIAITCPSSEIMNVMGPGIQELHGALAAQGVAPTGPWFTHHLKTPGESFDFEICLPVDAEVKPEGRVVNGVIAGGPTARTTYTGGYEGLGNAWGQFIAWIKDQNLTPASDLWEVYAKGPETGPDSSQYQTQLNRPLA
jgi:effector-binding domain-containing protein